MPQQPLLVIAFGKKKDLATKSHKRSELSAMQVPEKATKLSFTCPILPASAVVDRFSTEPSFALRGPTNIIQALGREEALQQRVTTPVLLFA